MIGPSDRTQAQVGFTICPWALFAAMCIIGQVIKVPFFWGLAVMYFDVAKDGINLSKC